MNFFGLKWKLKCKKKTFFFEVTVLWVHARNRKPRGFRTREFWICHFLDVSGSVPKTEKVEAMEYGAPRNQSPGHCLEELHAWPLQGCVLWFLEEATAAGREGNIYLHSPAMVLKEGTALILFWPCHVTCGVLVPWPGIEPIPQAVKVQSTNHWTARKFPALVLTDCFIFCLVPACGFKVTSDELSL